MYLNKTRDLMYKGGKHPVLELAMTCALPYVQRIFKQEKRISYIFNEEIIHTIGFRNSLTIVLKYSLSLIKSATFGL